MVIARVGRKPECRPRSRPFPASSHTPDRGGITRGGAGEGTPSPPKRTIPALPQSPRAGAGDVAEIARVGRKPRVPAPIPPFPGVIPCTGPWGYHPGRGQGGNSLPVEENHTGPSPGVPAQERGISW